MEVVSTKTTETCFLSQPAASPTEPDPDDEYLWPLSDPVSTTQSETELGRNGRGQR